MLATYPLHRMVVFMLDQFGCKNLRDVGGIVTRCGAVIRRGRLFRSAAPSFGADLTAGLGIHRVIDLRASIEFEIGANNQAAMGCEYLHIPLFETIPERWSSPSDRTPEATAARYFEMLEEGLQSLLQIVPVLGTCDTRPTLIHCVSGRDRTGIVIACVLDLLGVPGDAIAQDYALSNVMDDHEGRNANPANILLLLRLVRQKYQSTREMLKLRGASEDAFTTLSDALLGGRTG
jgi:protein-tyrosine phosphatase